MSSDSLADIRYIYWLQPGTGLWINIHGPFISQKEAEDEMNVLKGQAAYINATMRVAPNAPERVSL